MKFGQYFLAVAIVSVAVFGLAFAQTNWQEPDLDPPGCEGQLGCYQPLNVSGVSQQKLGGLDMGGFISRWHGIYHGDVRFNNWLPNQYEGFNSVNSAAPVNSELARRLTVWIKNCAGSPYGPCSSGDDRFGSIGVHYYCDETGRNCFQASDVGVRPASKIIRQYRGAHGGAASLTVACPAGHVVSGGGYKDDSVSGDGEMAGSYPSNDGRSWICHEQRAGDGFSCYAVCVQGTANFVDQGDQSGNW